MRFRTLSPFSALPFTLLFLSSVSLAQQTSRDLNRPARNMNPDLSLTVLGLYRNSRLGNDVNQESPNGLSLQETEIQLTSDVDPYLRALGILGIRQEGAEGYSIEPEEVYFETLQIPYVTLKAGKFRTVMGRHNLLHTHAFPFIDPPLTRNAFFGIEGLNDVGLSAATLIPAPWYLEVVTQALAGKSEFYASPSTNDLAGVAQIKSLWDLSDSASLELQIFGTSGKNSQSLTSQVHGVDLTYKWRPVQGGLYRSVAWTTEWLSGTQKGNPDGERNGGIASWIQYQFAQRWWFQVRGEYLGLGRSENVDPARRQSVLLGFFPSEFSGFRMQYDHLAQQNQKTDHAVALQFIMSLGAHPAHLY